MTDRELAEEYRWYTAAVKLYMSENDPAGVDRSEHKIATLTDEIIKRFLERAEEEE